MDMGSRKIRRLRQEVLATTTCTQHSVASWRTPPPRWPWVSLARESALDSSTWSRTYGSDELEPGNASKLTTRPDQQVRQRLGPEALLQRVQRIRPAETRPSPLPMATQALVAPDLTQRGLWLRQHSLLPPSKRRHQQPRHVHPHHGLHNLRPAVHNDRRS